MVIFITGGSRGIGYNIMETALSKGHDVAFTYNNPETDIDKIINQAKQIAPTSICKAYQLDVCDSLQVGTVVSKVFEDFDIVDAVINNAGINKNQLAFNMSDEEWATVIQTNLTGSFYVIREFLPYFLANKKGRFVSVSSIAKDGMAGQANYSASKAGLVGLSGAIAKEYGKKGITSNVVVPGMFGTDMTDESMSEQMKQFWLTHCPIKRMGKLSELSELVLFLASDDSSFINGQAINITGGLDWAG
jgi:3-oxoacyl-[acyl-carrier protein] reductase